MRQREALVADHDLDGLGHRTQDPHGDAVLALVRPEDAVRIVVGAVDDAIEVIDIDLHGAGGIAALGLLVGLGLLAHERRTSAMWATAASGTNRT